MPFKSEAIILLGISERKRQRLCAKYYHELSLLGYHRDAQVINKACFQFLKEKVAKKPKVYISRKEAARKLKISSKTLTRRIKENIDVSNQLESTGFKFTNKGFTKVQSLIIYDAWADD